MRSAIGIAMLFAAVATAAPAAHAQGGNSAAGKQLYESKGCYSCHGYVGQGSREGPRLAPALPLPAFEVQLRTPRAIMPPYTETLLTAQQVADIHAFLDSLPKPPDPKSIRLLQ